MGIRPEVLTELISIGCEGRGEIPPSLLREDVAWRSLVCGNEPWRRVAHELGASDLENLIKGIVLYSQASRRSTGGSVSPVIVLYEQHVLQFPDREPALTAWIVDHRTNPYEPFGSAQHQEARSLHEFRQISLERRIRAHENTVAEAERQERAREDRLFRERREASTRLTPAIRRGDLLAVKALVAKGADLAQEAPGGGSLVSYAEANGRDHIAEYLRSIGIC